MMKLRLASTDDLPVIWQIILQAKAQMYRENKQQWDESYPLPDHLQSDIDRGHAHVLEDEGKVIAYGAIAFDGEPAYDAIEGEWLSVQPYVVLHRLAVADEAKIAAAADKLFDFRPAAIIKKFDLRRPIYCQLAAYGHMGREDLDIPWEKTDLANALKKELGL